MLQRGKTRAAPLPRYRGRIDLLVTRELVDNLGEAFKILDGAVGLGMMTRSGGQLAVAHGAQFPAQRLLGDADPEFLPDPLAQIDQPPAHNAINRRSRTAFDRRPQRRAVCLAQLRRLARRLAGDQPVRTMGVELDHPIPNDLQCSASPRHRRRPAPEDGASAPHPLYPLQWRAGAAHQNHPATGSAWRTSFVRHS